MVYTKIQLQNVIKKLILEFKKKVKVDKILLYGSYASGKPHDWSDIDLAVISSNFSKMSRLKRIEKLLDATYNINCEVDIEPLGFSPQEYEEASKLTFLGEIKRTGKIIYAK